LSLLKPRLVPVPKFRRSGDPVPERITMVPQVSVPSASLFQRVLGGPSAPTTGAEDVQTAAQPAPTPARAQSPEAPKKRTRNTRHPTVKPIDKPKPAGQDKPRRTRHVAHTVRDVKIVISVSREEASIWHDCAKRDGRSMSEWVRRTIFDVAKIAPRPHAERDVAMGAIDTRNSKG